MALNRKQLQKRGPKGHNLAHITPMEEVILKALGGSGKVHPPTKIKQYGEEDDDDWGEEGDDDDTDTYDSSQDDYAGSGSGGTITPGGMLDSQGEVTTTSDGGTTISSGSDGKSNWSYNPFTNEWADLDVGRWWSEVAVPWFKETFGREPTAEEQKKLKTEHETGGDGSTVAAENVLTYADWEGIEHDTQAAADAANAVLLSTAQTGAIGGAEGFEYGSAVTDEEGNVTDESLTGTYRGAYEQMLADAYDAAKTGVGSGLASSGGLPTYDDAGNEIDPYAALESEVAGQSTYLDTLAANYQAEAQRRYDDWLATNTANINAITGENAEGVSALDQIKNYQWTDMPEYDTDWSGGVNPDTGEWDEDWMPEFYSGFDKEYGRDYLAPDSWEYDDEGNIIPGSYTPATTGTTETTEGDTTNPASPDQSAAPGINKMIEQGKKAVSGISQFGNNRSAARYI